jgi:hypothetical protein
MIKIYVDHILEDGKRGSLTMINIKKKKVSPPDVYFLFIIFWKRERQATMINRHKRVLLESVMSLSSYVGRWKEGRQ